jgi:cysteine desulfurase
MDKGENQVMKPFYFDYNATTPVMPEVVDAMLPFFTEHIGNPANTACSLGRAANRAVERAREQTAALIRAESKQITFTSGATESLNLAIKGYVQANSNRGRHILALPTEHSAVLDTLNFLSEHGFEIEYIPLNKRGMPELERFQFLLRKDTLMVCCMLANNETGHIYPVQEIASITHEAGSTLVCDATQACGKIDVDVNNLGVDFLALSSHKFGGPKGVGALYCKGSIDAETLTPLLHGGRHEKGLRSGTLNVPGIVGMGRAAEISKASLSKHRDQFSAIKDYLERFFISELGAVGLADAPALSNTLYMRIPGILAKDLIQKIPEVCFSSGSACQAMDGKLSHVPMALGYSNEEAKCFFRLSWGWATKMKEAEQIADLFLGTRS